MDALNERFDRVTGDTVTVDRFPVREDGNMHLPFWTNVTWTQGYDTAIFKPYINNSYRIMSIDEDGMIHLVGVHYRLPFFLFKGYDHLDFNLKYISKSGYREWDRKMQDRNYTKPKVKPNYVGILNNGLMYYDRNSGSYVRSINMTRTDSARF